MKPRREGHGANVSLEARKEFVSLLRQGKSIPVACKHAKVSRAALCRWLRAGVQAESSECEGFVQSVRAALDTAGQRRAD
jgi:hypothetical protein